MKANVLRDLEMNSDALIVVVSMLFWRPHYALVLRHGSSILREKFADIRFDPMLLLFLKALGINTVTAAEIQLWLEKREALPRSSG